MKNLRQELSLATLPAHRHPGVSRDQYESWLRHYTWHAVQGLRYGESFCQHFAIEDNILCNFRSRDLADDYICAFYVHTNR